MPRTEKRPQRLMSLGLVYLEETLLLQGEELAVGND